jgi:hypothetical protein
MRMMRRIGRVVSTVLIMAIATLGVQFHAHAGLVGAETVIAAEQAALDRGKLLAALDRIDVRQQLIAFGVDPDEARDRVAALSDDELAQMAGQLDQLPAGAGPGSVIGALVFIFIVLLITDILGFTDVFPFVKKTVN